jgi:glyoxylase-like metal-dependent hydrolase (beta-lactamase superfamily II)
MGIKLTGIHLGYMGLDKELMAFPNPELILSAGRQAGAKQWYQCPSLGFIIDHPDGRILWNTGLSTAWDQEWLDGWKWLIDLTGITPETCVENRLKQLGLGPDDFKYVVQGHLHTDHAGGLRFFERAGAEILVHEDEWKHTQHVEQADNFFVRKDWHFLTGSRKPTLIYKDQELLKDVHLVHLPGHTPGTTGVLLKLDRTGWVMLTDDAMYVHETFGPPAVGTPITWNVPHWSESIEKIRTIAIEHDAFLFPNHDETGVKVSHAHDQITTEFRKIEFQPFSPGYAYE